MGKLGSGQAARVECKTQSCRATLYIGLLHMQLNISPAPLGQYQLVSSRRMLRMYSRSDVAVIPPRCTRAHPRWGCTLDPVAPKSRLASAPVGLTLESRLRTQVPHYSHPSTRNIPTFSRASTRVKRGGTVGGKTGRGQSSIAWPTLQDSSINCDLHQPKRLHRHRRNLT